MQNNDKAQLGGGCPVVSASTQTRDTVQPFKKKFPDVGNWLWTKSTLPRRRGVEGRRKDADRFYTLLMGSYLWGIEL